MRLTGLRVFLFLCICKLVLQSMALVVLCGYALLQGVASGVVSRMYMHRVGCILVGLYP